MKDYLDSRVEYLNAVQHLAEARTRYSEAWLRHRTRASSDQQATHRATVETKDEVTLFEAQLELTRRNLNRQ